MGKSARQKFSIILGIIMLLGIAVYFRLWTIDYQYSSNDAELLRRQFDLASKEAMDESADWRRRFDLESEKADKCSRELEVVKKSVGEKQEVSTQNRIEMLQKENIDLLERLESLKQELEAQRLKCSAQDV